MITAQIISIDTLMLIQKIHLECQNYFLSVSLRLLQKINTAPLDNTTGS